MFYQENVYVATEYGTRTCKAYREPCGAFYGVPFSGEIQDIGEYDREQFLAALPSRSFSRRDELKLARMRGEDVELPQEVKKKPMSEDPMIVATLTTEFSRDTGAPPDVVKEYRDIARRYAQGERYLVNNLHDLYTLWMSRRY